MSSPVAPALSHDFDEGIIFVEHPEPIELTNRTLIGGYFDAVMSYWRQHFQPRKVSFVVAYESLTVDPRLAVYYGEQVGRIQTECATVIVRHGGTHSQRTVARVVGIRLGVRSRVFGSKQEAIAFVRTLRHGDGEQ